MGLLIHDTIKIHYTEQGYLQDYPYHLISDTEMMHAFISLKENYKELEEDEEPDINYIVDNYQGYFISKYIKPMINNLTSPNVVTIAETLQDEIKNCMCKLTMTIISLIDDAIQDIIAHEYESNVVSLPDWVYSYMLGVTIGPKSDQLDIHDLLVLLDTDNIEDIYDGTSAYECMRVSKRWLRKSVSDIYDRPVTCFGEAHVIKSLRLDNII